MSFHQVRQEFSLPAHIFFRYLQVRHFVPNHFNQFSSYPSKSPLDSILETPPEVRGTISRLYTIIFEMEGSSLSIIRENWEKDMDTNISEDKWDSIIQRIHSSSIYVRHNLIQFVHRLHVSKAKLSKIFPGVNPMCDRCKQVPATLYHTSDMIHIISLSYHLVMC